uniref:cytidine deaminase n=1 Tax=Davidia involucrata TaxID=16924 RepID=A0A5B6YPZ9_DAVIN
MDRPRFVIEASEAESMAKESGLSVLQLLPSLVKPAQKLARPPISKYHVGAVGLGSDGRIFLGVNLEFPGLPLHHSVHAEQFLITNLAVHGEPRLRYIAVSAAPCGHCRQFFQELRNASDIQILITSSENESEESTKFKPLSSILPNPFGPYDLLDEETPLLLEPHENGLSLLSKTIDSNCGNLCNGVCELYSKNESKLKIAALEAANHSHAPYSGCPSGVALMDCEGNIYRGFYMESAAYNPSLGPVQAALVAYVASGGGGGYDRIVAGVLVEKEGAVVRQEDSARLLLKMISPKCDFRVFLCSSASNGCKRPSSKCE